MRYEADRRGLEIAYAADTHLHADFLSGATQLAATGVRRCWPLARVADCSTTEARSTRRRLTLGD
ncbi:hypothetical protein [Nocardioides sp. B-3]|uniref:hypothetical protein n=1 Tax=Nocardioides sp. B-3 TaxID=2895565 RepID=UPI00215267B1|nr:hypothetical protein [Nocardioides sp. B-3]UUZ58224.1 hypothetical protein LP418_18490 [Nocardioides sp. B-3]